MLFIASSALQQAFTEDKLLIVAPGIPPISYEENGKPTGIGTELTREIFKRLGEPIEMKIVPGARALSMLQSGEADALFALAKTEERKGFAVFPEEILVDQPVSIFVKKSSSINYNGDIKSIYQYRIGIIRGGRFSSAFEAALANKLFKSVEEVDDIQLNISKLELGRIDIIVGSRLSILFYAKKMGKLNVIRELQPPIAASSPAYLAFSQKGKAARLSSRFDAVLREMRKDGAYDRILGAYIK
jgi:polar amino acid transport system substrate-binding protein